MPKKPLVSIILPVYNAEKYLDVCLTSVCNQSMKEIEIIAIDDGSNDTSLEILKSHARKDFRISIIEQENKGPSIARNNGLLNARGDYIGFIDSDDWIETKMIETMYETLIQHNTDIGYCAYREVYDQDHSKDFFLVVDCDGTLNKEMIKNSFCPSMISLENINSHENLIMGSVCRCLFNKKLIINNKLTFPEEIYFTEDLIFNLNCLLHADSISIINQVFYNYRMNQTSLTHKYLQNYNNYVTLSEKEIRKIGCEFGYGSELDEILNTRIRQNTLGKIVNICRRESPYNLVSGYKEVRKKICIEETSDAFSNFFAVTSDLKKKILYTLIKLKGPFLVYLYYFIKFRIWKYR